HFVDVDRVGLAVGADGFDAGHLPSGHSEVERHDASGRLQVLLQIRAKPRVRTGQQIESDHVSRAEIDLQGVVVNDFYHRRQTQRIDLLQGGFAELLGNFHAYGVRFEFLGGGDDDAAVPRAKIVDDFTRLDLRRFEHALDDDLGTWQVGS